MTPGLSAHTNQGFIEDEAPEDKIINEQPRLYVELNEATDCDEYVKWRKVSRWIKFEETFFPSSDRWGKPHIPFLAYQSISSLHRLLESGLILLDYKVDAEEDPFESMLLELEHDRLMNSQEKLVFQNVLSSKKRFHLDTEPAENTILFDSEILEHLPPGSEMAEVLVGVNENLEVPCLAFIRLHHNEKIKQPTNVLPQIRFVALCFGPTLKDTNYIGIGRSIGAMFANQKFQVAVSNAKCVDDVLAAFNAFLENSLVIKSGEDDQKKRIKFRPDEKLEDEKEKEANLQIVTTLKDGENVASDDPLRRIGRPFAGLVTDVKRRYPKYWSDIKDCLNLQVLAAVFFVYFISVSPAITFGGLLDGKTGGYMGASEMLMATSLSGIIFSLFSGQPLLIVGFTGPLLVFEESVYKFALQYGIDYFGWRFWIGLWQLIISVIFVALECSFIVKFFTRFIQEIFAIMICLIYIWEAVQNLVEVFHKYPLCFDFNSCTEKTRKLLASKFPNGTKILDANGSISVNETMPTNMEEYFQPNVALLSLVLTVTTLALSLYFKGLRNRKILGRTLRRLLSDFGVPLAILIICVFDYLIGDTKFTPKLEVPEKFGYTKPALRRWFAHPLGDKEPLPAYHFFTAAIPAALALIVIYMESLVTSMIVSKQENKLVKGTGFHLDIIVLGSISAIHGVLGLPFVSAATVRCISHVSALTVMNTKVPPGESPKIDHVIEQRVSAFVVALLVGASIFLGMVLKFIPMAALFGVFLYMGLYSLLSLQFYERLVMVITPKKHHPTELVFVRFVKMWKMHLFTALQLICIIALFAVKASPASIGLPFVLILIVVFRVFLMKYIFPPAELEQLDKSGSPVIVDEDKPEEEEEPEFHEQSHNPL